MVISTGFANSPFSQKFFCFLTISKIGFISYFVFKIATSGSTDINSAAESLKPYSKIQSSFVFPQVRTKLPIRAPTTASYTNSQDCCIERGHKTNNYNQQATTL